MTRTAKSALTIYDVSDGSSPEFERYYSTYPGILSEMGDPTTPGTGVTWTLASGAVPNTAYWIAERYTLAGGAPSAWQLMPVQAKESGIPFVTYIKGGFNKPVLGDSTWITDAVAAVSAFTGRTYTNQKEFGYGTTVVIEYANGKLYGRYMRSGTTDTWVAPAKFIDGNLIVDGSIAAPQIDANAITATKIAANAITATKIAANAITADKIAANAITADKISAGAITAAKINSGAITVDKLSVNSTSIYVNGNVIEIANGAINRTHSWGAISGSYILQIPYLATKVTLTGCGAGGGRVGGYNGSGTSSFGSLYACAGAGGGGACSNLAVDIPSGYTHLAANVGLGVVGGAGMATTVFLGTSPSGPWSQLLALGGGGVVTDKRLWPFTGQVVGAGGPVSQIISGRTANGSAGNATISTSNAFTFSMSGGEGGEAMTGYGSTRSDWEHGAGGVGLHAGGGGESLGFGCGVGGGAGYTNTPGGVFKNYIAGGPGFLNVTFGT